jgi:serine/threonine protein kinase
MSEQSPLHSPGGKLFATQRVGAGRYILVRQLGRGGMGVVWMAHDERLDEKVALKFLPQEINSDSAALEDLRRETLRSRKLTHPNIIRIHDLYEARGEAAFISMEFVEGLNLIDLRIRRGERVLHWPELKPLLQQLCDALDYAHSEKVVHRDLKPANMMLDAKGRLKLADFGIAATISDATSRVSVRHASSGTLAYMSPQQLDGEVPKVADDMYALGATIYELLTSRPPFFAGEVAYQVRNLPPKPMDERLAEFEIQNEVPSDVAALVMACLAKDPAQRPQSARAVADWIGLELGSSTALKGQSLFTSEAASVGIPPEQADPEHVGRNTGRGKILAGAAALVLAITAILLTVLFVRSNHGASNSPPHSNSAPMAMITRPNAQAWVPLNISAAFNANIITTADRKAADALTFNGGHLTASSWLRKNRRAEAGIPDFGRLAIPGAEDGDFQIQMPPGKDAILVTSPPGPHPSPVTIELSPKDRAPVSELAILHETEWCGSGLLRVTLGYEIGDDTVTTLRVFDCWPGSRPVPLPADMSVATTTVEIRATGDNSAELFAQEISADPKRVLRSITFSFDSVILPPKNISSQTSYERFVTAIFAISARRADDRATAASEPAIAPPLTASDIPTNGLILYFNFDEPPENGIVQDQSGHGNDGKAVGVQWIPDGKRGGALLLSPSDSSIRVASNDSLNPAQFTVCAWVKSSFVDHFYRRIFDKGLFHNAFCLSIDGDYAKRNPPSRYRGFVEFESARNPALRSIHSVTNGKWHYISATFDGREVCLFIDGQPQSRAPCSNKSLKNNLDLVIGGFSDPDPAADDPHASFNGALDEIMIFNRALTAAEVWNLYESINTPESQANGSDNTVPTEISNASGNAPTAPGASQLTYGLYLHFGTATFTPGDSGEQLPPERFSPEVIDTAGWAKTAKDAGMNYAILTAKHESGFCLWKTDDYDYDLKNSPVKSDIIGSFIAACDAQGIAPGVHYSIPDAHNEGTARFSGPVADSYFQIIKKHVAELHTKHPGLRVQVFAGAHRLSQSQWDELSALVRQLNPRCVIFDHNHPPRHISDTVNISAGFGNKGSGWMWSPTAKLTPIADLLTSYNEAKNSHESFLLNVGVDSSGHIPEAYKAVLMEMKNLTRH